MCAENLLIAAVPGEFRRVADFETDIRRMLRRGFAQKIGTHIAEAAQTYCFSVLCRSLETLGNVDDILRDVLVHHVPRPAAETQSFALAYRMEPETVMVAYPFAGLFLDNRAYFDA